MVDQVGMARDYANMGAVYQDKGQLDESLQYHKKALEIHEELEDRVNLVGIYCNIGYVYIAKNDNKEATLAANSALTIVQEFEKETGYRHQHRKRVETLVSRLK